MQLTPGTLLERGKYRIIETLGRGGFGVTYLAEQVMAKRKVCIKEFFPKDYYKRDGDTGALTLSSDGFAESMNKFKAKFVKEAQTIAALDHHNIIPIHDVFEENGTAYYVMDYIEGESLSERVKRGGAMSERDAVAYIKQVASALEHIHEQQIMHLDVKPGNIMVRTKDDRAILIDFGLSKHYDATSGEATSTTPVGVSHGYAPMEQYKQGGVNRFSPETDIYSLGATLYYLVTGNVPPQAADIPEEGIVFPTDMSSNVRETIARSMSYLRKDRPHTIKDFLALLDNDEPIVAVIVDEEEKTKIATHKPAPKRESNEDKPKPKKHRWWLLLLLLLLIGGGAWFIFGDNKEEKNTESEALPEENVENEALPEEDVALPAVDDVALPEEDVTLPAVDDVALPEEDATLPAVEDVALPEEDATLPAEDVAFPETVAPYQVGDLYNESGKRGVVFEVWDDGCHGKIVSLDEAELQWCTDEQFKRKIALGLTNKSNGKANTDNVMKREDSDQYPPFVWCHNKGDDWYLPASDELKAIFNSKSKINSTLAEYGAQLNDYYWYWSSTEYGSATSRYGRDSDAKICALYVGMSYGNASNGKKSYDSSVRAVATF